MSQRIHRLLRTLLLPRWFRARHGPVMAEVWREALNEARGRGLWAVVRLWAHEVADLSRTGRELRMEATRRKKGDARSPRETHDAHPGGGMTGRWLRTVGDDLRWAGRSLARRPSFTLVAALTVALGVGASTAIYSTIESVLLRPLPFEGGDRVVNLWQRAGDSGGFFTPSPERQEAWADQPELFDLVVPFRSGHDMTLSQDGAALSVDAVSVAPQLHELIHTWPMIGRTFTEEERDGDGARVVILSHALWSTRFGKDPGILGRSITLNGEPWTVVGVMPPGAVVPTGVTVDVDIWLPLPKKAARGTGVLARLRPGVTTEMVEERLASVEERLVQEGVVSQAVGAAALPVAELIGRSMEEPLRLLAVGVALLLLVACVNVSNLLLSRANARRQETAVRTALGASGRRLMRQLVLESLILGLLGAAGGLAFTVGVTQLVPLLRPDDLEVLERIRIDGGVWIFSLGLAMAAGMAFGLAPAWSATRPEALDPLRSGARTDAGGILGRRMRWGLVGAEMALSFALLVGSFLLFQSLSGLQQADPGFRVDGLVVAHVSLPSWKYDGEEERRAAWERMDERLAGIPGVQAAIPVNGMPPRSGILFGTLDVEGRAPESETRVFHGPSVGSGFFHTAGLPLVAGRAFTPDEIARGADAFILGETTVRRLLGVEPDDAVGMHIRVGGGDEDPWATVVGVAHDILMRGPASSEDVLQIYTPLSAAYGDRDFLLRVGGDAQRVMGQVRPIVAGVEPDALLGTLTTADRMMGDTLARERFATSLLSAFAWLALALSGVGLYGVVSQVVSQRTREFGIRVSLGAASGDIRSMVLRQGAVVTLLGMLAGAGLTAVGAKLLQSQFFGLGSVQPGAYAVAALVLGGATFAAMWIPARRATRIAPAEALRAE